MTEKLNTLTEYMRGSLSKESMNEVRLMLSNMKPHELIRMIMIALSDFEPRGDLYWPLRKIRDYVLDYLRCLSEKYPGMKALEKSHLCRVIVFEACRRQLEGVEQDQQEREKFHFTLKVMSQIEKSERGLKHCAKLFTSVVGDIDEQTLRRCYQTNLSFRWLLESGSIEAHYEMQI